MAVPAKSAQLKAQLQYGPNDSLKLDTTVQVDDIVALLHDIVSGTPGIQVSSSSLALVANGPVTTTILGGTPQTNVRLLILLASP